MAPLGGEWLARGTVALDTPIERNGQKITQVTLRKPKAGELRGTTLNALVNLDVDALAKVLPRISSPMLTEHDIREMDPADLVQMGVAFADFLLPNRAR
nr:phage tail assembly protein [Paraburkholderia lycopersici]